MVLALPQDFHAARTLSLPGTHSNHDFCKKWGLQRHRWSRMQEFPDDEQTHRAMSNPHRANTLWIPTDVKSIESGCRYKCCYTSNFTKQLTECIQCLHSMWHSVSWFGKFGEVELRGKCNVSFLRQLQHLYSSRRAGVKKTCSQAAELLTSETTDQGKGQNHQEKH